MASIIRRILEKYEKRIHTVEYWKKKGLKIGHDCEVYSTAHFGSEPYLITIGNHVRINHNVNFITHDGGTWVLRALYNNQELDLFAPIEVGNNVHIGTNAMIMPGVKIGTNCIIGCCAVVTHDIPDNSVAVGIPAKVIETTEEYYKKHKKDFFYTKHMNEVEKEKALQVLIKKKNE